jgi:hypothetical protein
MRVRNVVLGGIAAAAALAAGAAWWAYASRDALLQRAIETFGPQLTGVAVTVSRVKLEPAEGKGAVVGLVVGNPPGYKTPNSLALGEMRLAIDFATVTSNVVHLRELVIDAPVITYERGPGGDNLGVIQKNLGGGGGAKKAGPPGKKFVIDSLRVTNARVRFSDAVILPIPDLHLRDVGGKSNGATAGEITRTVWDSMAGNANNLASRAGALSKDGLRSLFK